MSDPSEHDDLRRIIFDPSFLRYIAAWVGTSAVGTFCLDRIRDLAPTYTSLAGLVGAEVFLLIFSVVVVCIPLALVTARMLRFLEANDYFLPRVLVSICIIVFNILPACCAIYVVVHRKHIQPAWLDTSPPWTAPTEMIVHWGIPAICGLLAASIPRSISEISRRAVDRR